MRGVLAGGPSASGTGTGRGRGRIYASWTRCRSAPTPKARFCSLGTIRKLTTHKTSFRSAAVIAALRTLHPRCADCREASALRADRHRALPGRVVLLANGQTRPGRKPEPCTAGWAALSRRWQLDLSPESEPIVVGVVEAELADTPGLVLHELAHQPDRMACIPSTAHLGLHCRPDAR